MLTLNAVEKWLAPWRQKMNGMIAKAIVELITDSSELQLLKLTLNGQAHSEVERVQNYGFTSRPPKGSQAVVVFVGGNRDNPLVIAADDGRVRVQLDADGEAAFYSEHGNKIVLKANGDIEATPKTGQKFIINGNLDVVGIIDASVDVKAGPLNVGLISHTHISASPGSPTGIGVG